MTLIRVLAILYSYYQFLQLHKLGSKYILGIAGLFTVFSSFIFTSTVLNFLRIDVTDLKDALFFFLLLIDLSKAAMLAEFALSASNQDEVRHNIARGMAVLGPSITLDTIVETLVIGVGTLSGVHRLEMLSCFACLSVVVNYIVFMTFYPACLSLILELSRTKLIISKKNIESSLISRALKEADQKSNPVVQRVKLIMSAGLMLVHAHSWWPVREEDDAISPLVEQRMILNRTEENALHGYVLKWVQLSADHIVILILLLALVVKFVFFENNEELAQLRVRMSEPERPKVAHNDSTTAAATANGSINNQTRLDQHSRAKENMDDKPVSEKVIFDWDEDKIVETAHKSVQTEATREVPTANGVIPEKRMFTMEPQISVESADETSAINHDHPPRSLEECVFILKEMHRPEELSDDEVLMLVQHKHIASYQVETVLANPERGVGIRRKLVGGAGNFFKALDELPYKDYDYSKVMGACCENVIGYVPIPVGVAGPLKLDGKLVYVPMATTEGCLVASTNRGSRALLQCGVNSRIVADGMTRGPVVRFPSVNRASDALGWLETPPNYAIVKEAFDSSSRFARLTRVHTRIAGRHLFIRFVARTGDAMGMNMLSKGTEESLRCLQKSFPDMEVLSLSGNFCTDKKPAAVNWIEGRGKSVVCEAIVPAYIVTNVLKTSVAALVDVNISKNMVGSAIAGSIGGFNAHAANVVTAIFIATGQDPAQNVGSSNCMTLMEPWGDRGEDLYITCTMPSIEIGTIGGGTILSPQAACLDMLGVRGAHTTKPGENANQLARVVCGTVLAGELSLMAALTAGHLVKSHLRHNRSTAQFATTLSNGSNGLNGTLGRKDSTRMGKSISSSTLLVPPCKDPSNLK